MTPSVELENPQKLRELAPWYREYAERANAPWVSEGRSRTAEDLERHAALLEENSPSKPRPNGEQQPNSWSLALPSLPSVSHVIAKEASVR